MDKIIKKVQQDYIAAKLKDDRAAWCKTENGIMLTFDGASLYVIPNQQLHIALQPSGEVPKIKTIIEKDDGYRPGEYKGNTCDGFAVFRADDMTVIADPKRVKPFLNVKGVQIKIQSPITAIKFYSANDEFIGAVWPQRQKHGRSYEL